MLGLEKPIPLEFLIDGSYLRTSIDDYLSANGISSETTLVVEFARALLPPTYVATFEHDDWVGCVDLLSETSAPGRLGQSFITAGQERILSGSYDGYLRLWDTSSTILATSSPTSEGGHQGPIKSAKFLNPNQIVSGGLDRTLRIWNCGPPGADHSTSISLHGEFYGHTASVDSVATHAPSQRILSASADHTVGLWSTNISENPEAPTSLLPSSRQSTSGKKRKISTKSQTRTPKGPLLLLRGHTDAAAEVIFDDKDATVGYSASWDHTIRTWDLVTSALVDTRTTASALLSLTHLSSRNLIAAGTSEKDIKLIDPRDSASTVSVMTLRGHTNAVVSLASDPDSQHGLVSGSYDGACRIWDIRSSKRSGQKGVISEAVYTIERDSNIMKGKGRGSRVLAGEGLRVFDVCWDKKIGIVSASEDKRVQINRQ